MVAPTEAVTLSSTKQLAFNLFRQGKSVEHVATSTNRSPSTVNEYLVEYIAELQQCDPAPWVSESNFEKVREAAVRVGTERLKPIFDALGQQVEYDQIRLSLACIKNLPPESPAQKK